MKNSTALKQSRASLRFLIVAVPCMWGLFFWLHWWQLAMFAGFMTLYLIFDAWNIVSIRKAKKKDPDYLKEKITGT